MRERVPDIVFSPNINWECHIYKEISWIIMTVVLFEKASIGKMFFLIAKFTQKVKEFVVT